jgi:DNA-binding transcriptional regulator LsrR (DeoR family)
MGNNKTLSEDEQLQVRASWLYHIEGLRQGDIAKHLKVTRLKVNRALQEARKKGIVRVQINSPYAPCMNLESEFKKRFNLSDVSIVPAASEETKKPVIVGAQLGYYLSNILKNPKIKVFGLAWGSVLRFASSSLVPCQRKDLEIVCTMGGLPHGSEVNGFEITTAFSQHFSSHRTYFTAPLYANTKDSRNTIMVQGVFQEILGKILRADVTATSVGDLETSTIVRYGLPESVSRKSLLDAGAVGELMGFFMDEDGNMVDHPINDCIVGISPQDLKLLPNAILAAGGQTKVPILAAVLKKEIFNTFVTDQHTAEGILNVTQ